MEEKMVIISEYFHQQKVFREDLPVKEVHRIRKTQSEWGPGYWNSMRVRDVNGDITVIVNGTTSATLHNDPGRKQGHFGLQLHGGQEMLVMFKVIRVKDAI